jgi:ferredoxin, 2Fe-2S
MKVHVTLPDGSRREVAGADRGSLMELLRTAGLPIRAECGGAMACATCHVVVNEAWRPRVGPPTDEESDLLDMSDYRQDGSRLCCQIRATAALEGLAVALQLDAFEG